MRFLYPLLALILTVLPLSAQELFRGTAPDWVQPITVPDPTPALLEMAEDGQLYVLSDQQVAWAGEERFTYQRTATKVTERAGLERQPPSASTLTRHLRWLP
jgi:hypothetical protein